MRSQKATEAVKRNGETMDKQVAMQQGSDEQNESDSFIRAKLRRKGSAFSMGGDEGVER
jgi:hypothetical protein